MRRRSPSLERPRAPVPDDRRESPNARASFGVGGATLLFGGIRGIEPGFVAGESGDPQTLLAAGLVVAFAAIHLYGGRVFELDVVPRSRLLSLSGGVSVSYVFVHVLPEIRETEEHLADGVPLLPSVEERVYLIALLGFVLYYGLEQFVRSSAVETGADAETEDEAAADGDRPAGRHVEDSGTSIPVFWTHVGSFAAYNGLIGYLLFHREAPGVGSVALFGLAMGLHLLVNDFGLRDRHRDAYHRFGRWVLAFGVVAGGVAGALTSVDRAVLGVFFAFLSGGIILNVIKEELPSERESRFRAFAAGAVAYALLLVRV